MLLTNRVSFLLGHTVVMNRRIQRISFVSTETTRHFRDLFVSQGLEPAAENAALIRQAMAILEEIGEMDFLEEQVAALEELRSVSPVAYIHVY